MDKLPYLNLGCGGTYHLSWTNVDFISDTDHVVAHNLLQGVPFPDSVFQVVYHSHVLEHFPKSEAKPFIAECNRVLKPGGIIRIAVPDLERIVRNYLQYLDEALQGNVLAKEKYEWSMLEMYDQVVRKHSGGDMIEYLRDEKKENDAFLIKRNGSEAERLLKLIRHSPKEEMRKPHVDSSIKGRIKDKLLRRWFGKDYKAMLDAAVFRSQGEIHQWMYDRFSLKLLLEDCGFVNAKVVSAFESMIPEWNIFELDGKNGSIRKPDSLFMEAQKK